MLSGPGSLSACCNGPQHGGFYVAIRVWFESGVDVDYGAVQGRVNGVGVVVGVDVCEEGIGMGHW